MKLTCLDLVRLESRQPQGGWSCACAWLVDGPMFQQGCNVIKEIVGGEVMLCAGNMRSWEAPLWALKVGQ